MEVALAILSPVTQGTGYVVICSICCSVAGQCRGGTESRDKSDLQVEPTLDPACLSGPCPRLSPCHCRSESAARVAIVAGRTASHSATYSCSSLPETGNAIAEAVACHDRPIPTGYAWRLQRLFHHPAEGGTGSRMLPRPAPPSTGKTLSRGWQQSTAQTVPGRAFSFRSLDTAVVIELEPDSAASALACTRPGAR